MKRAFLCLSILVMAGLNLPQDVGGDPPPPDEGAFTYMGELHRLGESYSGTADFRFTLWDAPTAGAQVAPTQERSKLAVSDGLFQARLSFDETMFDGAARWLEIEVRTPSGEGRFTTLAPRQEIVSSRSDLRDVNADEAGDENGDDSIVRDESDQQGSDGRTDDGAISLRQDRSSGVLRDGSAVAPEWIPTALRRLFTLDDPGDDGIEITAGSPWVPDSRGIHYRVANVGIGVNSSRNPRLSVRTNRRSGRAVFGLANPTTGTNYGVYGQSKSNRGHGVFGIATATSGANFGVHGQSDSTEGTGVFGEATATTGATLGVLGKSSSISGAGVMGWATAGTGSTQGVVGQSSSTSGRGVSGWATASSGTNYGVWGKSGSGSGTGVFGDATATTGFAFGVHGQSASNNGRGVFGEATATTGFAFGVHGESSSTQGRGVLGLASATTGITYGGWFKSASTTGTGVFGEATTTAGNTYGGRFESASTSGTGVFGNATATSGVTTGVYGQSSSFQGAGVRGLATATAGANFGVKGESASSSGTGVWGEATSSNGFTQGVTGKSTSRDGRGVLGWAAATSGSRSIGVYGQSDSPQGWDFFAGGSGGRYGGASSIRWKRNIKPIDDPLYKLAQLRGVYFDWDAEHGGQHDLGMIAEEVGAVLPEIVSYEENGVDAIGMDYSKMTPLLTQAINALREKQDARFEQLESENAQLRERLTELEALVSRLASQQKGNAQ